MHCCFMIKNLNKPFLNSTMACTKDSEDELLISILFCDLFRIFFELR